MSDKTLPDWAIEKALVRFNERNKSTPWTPGKIRSMGDLSTLGFCEMVIAHAMLIAEHEEAPDPLAVAFEALYNDGLLRTHADMIRTALLRGFEIGKAES